MNIKKTIGVAILSTIALQAVALEEVVKVLGVTPIYKEYVESVPYRSCETKKFYRNSSYGGSKSDQLAGAIIGGAIGNQFGGGKGKDALTVFGALLGAEMAKEDGGRNQSHGGYYYKDVCETKYRRDHQSVISYYKVKYEYNGSEITGTMRSNPGEYVKIRVRTEIIN
jgi:uncharacterized protein YcfJ